MAQIVAATARASEAFAGVPEFVSSPELAVPCADDVKFEIAARMADCFARDYEVLTIDGVRVSFPDDGSGEGWALVRASNTGPILTLRFEATSEARYEAIRTLVLHELQSHVPIPNGLGAR
jgi:phosphomannomutase/phosphoglucomutase